MLLTKWARESLYILQYRNLLELRSLSLSCQTRQDGVPCCQTGESGVVVHTGICKKANLVVWHLGVEAEGRQPVGSTSIEHAPQHLTNAPLQQPSRPEGGDTGAASQGPTTSASGMSLQPPSLPAPFLQQQHQQQQGMPAQLVPGSAQAQQQQQAAVAAAAIATSPPREAGQLGVAGQKQAPKPPLAPGSKSVSQVSSAFLMLHCTHP